MCHCHEKDTLQVAGLVVVLEQFVVRMECCYRRSIHRGSRVHDVRDDEDENDDNDDDDDDDEC